MDSIRWLDNDNETKSHLIEVLIRNKFNKELGINLVHVHDCEYADLVDKKRNIYIRVDADCENYKEWVVDVNGYLDTYMVCIYVGFTGSVPSSNDERAYNLKNQSNLIVIDPTYLNNLTMDLIRLKIHRWCEGEVKPSKFNEKASDKA